jgi:hypothetical protein
MIAPAPVPQRVANSQAVVVGKVTAIEDTTITAPAPYPGATNKVEYTIAVVKIEDALLGAKGLTFIKVGFVTPQTPPPPPDGGIRVPVRRYPQAALAKDQEVCVFLNPLADQPFYVMQNYFDVIDKKTPGFEKEVEMAKRCARLLGDPDASLKGKDAEDRFLTAAMLLTRYRAFRGPGNPKQEPIDAAQSKAILLALADADWTQRNDPTIGFQMMPQNVFFQLGIGPKDGWVQPKNAREIPEAAKKWLRDNAETYRIQRYVTEKAEK